MVFSHLVLKGAQEDGASQAYFIDKKSRLKDQLKTCLTSFSWLVIETVKIQTHGIPIFRSFYMYFLSYYWARI